MKQSIFRFTQDATIPLNDQMHAFLTHPALEAFYDYLKVDKGNPFARFKDFNQKYNLREIKDKNGDMTIIPEQCIQTNPYILDAQQVRSQLYQCLTQLGFFSSFESRLDNPSHLVVLGGPLLSNKERMEFAKTIDTDSISFIYALGCKREILELERQVCPSLAKTEFESLCECVETTFNITEFIDMNPQIRKYPYKEKEIFVLSAPSSKKDYRADTLDTLHYFEKISHVHKDSQILFITHPGLVNGHGLTIYQWAKNLPFQVDVIGCQKESTEANYSIARMCQYMIRILRQICKENL